MNDKRNEPFQGNSNPNKTPYLSNNSSTDSKSNRDSTEKHQDQSKFESITFRDDKNNLKRSLLVKDAQDWAANIRANVAYTQIRKFYSEALSIKARLEDFSDKQTIEDRYRELDAEIDMLISKANYSKVRDKKNEELFNFINTCVQSIDSAQGYLDFVLFFEAVLGFYTRKD